MTAMVHHGMTLLLWSLLVTPGVALGADAAPSVALGADAALPPPPDAGPPPIAKMTCAPQPARIGETVRCVVTVDHRASVSITVEAPAGGDLEPANPASPHGAGLRTVRAFTYFPLSLKDVKVGEVGVRWQTTAGAVGRTTLPGVRIPVKSALAGQTKPMFRTFTAPQVEDTETFWTQHGPVPFRRFHKLAFFGVIAALVAVLGALLGVWINRWLVAHRRPEPVWVDPRPAHEIALAELDALQAQDLPGDGEVKPYYAALSEIVRAYLDRRFDLQALEMTSDEIRAGMADQTLSVEASLGLNDFLAETDLVKFADAHPGDAAIDTVMRAARGLIEATRILVEASPDAPVAEDAS